MTGQTPAQYLAQLADDWERSPFVGITNEGLTGQEFLRSLRAVLAELAELKACRPCGQSASHPPHKWMTARKALQCAGVGELPTAAGPDVPQEGAERGQEALCGPGASLGTPKAPEGAPEGWGALDAIDAVTAVLLGPDLSTYPPVRESYLSALMWLEMDVACGDCIEGRCHWGGAKSRESIAEAEAGREFPESCGCARHEVSAQARERRAALRAAGVLPARGENGPITT